ncbi:CgeB family protein [Corynebacterium riegelii]|uniref:Uncharacterized protein n=1 Tax=Corynebacterium riegelii TaxID=156976 RepID=A0A0K1R964_9CORY|nr:hypothetical protein [Corynebacterium riegelii]AKV57970.1 hypothetical protein AK829_00910 [Corynebacterium riegelii]
MRVCIFDGILETHVGASLERSFKKFGYETFNTGKIGSGFKFPKSYEDISHLEASVQMAIRFNPDVVFVMRPASLPHHLLRKIKRSGASIIAWFSDDPVLFDLSYGPVLSDYDLILHCGNEAVLRFYEDYFGYPTGVNFPFWTDHMAFPAVWGDREPDTDLVFLGNVHDPVRRERYFAFGETGLNMRVHGNIGADYYGLSGGYLVTDEEVVNSASTAKLALNIPQFFKDHRGLETWFPGLDKLGYFEYPSRVVQYMAMGIPTISIVPGGGQFQTYPEMGIAQSMQEAYELAENWLSDGNLASRSSAVLDRFDRHFSSDARVMAIENLLEDDSWRRLDTRERSSWFEQFDATEHLNHEQSQVEPAGVPVVAGGKTLKKVTLLTFGAQEEYSVARAVAEVFEENDDFESEVVQLEINPRLITDDPQGIVDHALVVGSDLLNRIGEPDWLLVVGAGIAITQAGADRLSARGIRTAIYCDQSISKWRKFNRLLEGYDGVLTPNFTLFERGKRQGFKNIGFVPYFVRPAFLRALEDVERRPEVIRIRQSAKHEEVMSPSIYNDAQFLDQTIVEYADLESMALEELAKLLKVELTFMTFAGSRYEPTIPALSPYVAVASSMMFSGRPAVANATYPYDELCYSAHDPGELKAKLNRIVHSSLPSVPGNSAVLNNIRDGRHFISEAERLLGSGNQGRGSVRNLASGTDIDVPLTLTSNGEAKSFEIRLWLEGYVGALEDWRVKLRIKDKIEYEKTPTGFDELFVDEVSDIRKLKLTLTYLGRALDIPKTLALKARAVAIPQTDIVGSPSTSRVYEVRG